MATESSNEAQNEESVGSDSAPAKPAKPSMGAKWRLNASKALEAETGRKVSFEPEGSTHHGNSYWNTLQVDNPKGRTLPRTKSTFHGLVKTVLEKSLTSGDQDLLFAPVRPYVIHPASNRYIIYQYCFIPFVFWTAWSAPFMWAFLNVGRSHPLSIVDYVVDLLFYVDIAMTFRVAYIERKTYLVVDEPKRIARRYLRSTFFPDVLVNFPYHVFGAHQWVRWMTLLKLWRLKRIGRLFSKAEKDIRINYFIARVSHLYLVVIFVAHVAACIMYELASGYPDYKRDSTWIALLYEDVWKERSVFDKYVASIYWSIVTLTTTGYGDFHPYNVNEFIFCCVYMLTTMAITSYVLGNMTAIIVKLSSRVQDYRDSISALDGFVARNRLPGHLRRQMKRHARLKFETEEARSDIVHAFPKSIRARISRYLYRDIVEHIYLFRECSREFVSTLVGDVKVEWFMPGEVIINERDAPTLFYILASGKVDILTTLDDGSEDVITTVDEGDIFGEIGVLCNMPQPFMCRATQLTKVLRVDRNDFSGVVQAYVKDGSQVVNNLLERTKNEDDVLAMKLSDEIVSLIKQQEAELTMTLVYVASRGDLVHLQKLMHGGVDPNKADYDGRTPLHLAASKGYDEILRFLIREGADVNFRDNFGTTPLNEALKAGQDDAARLLWESGARLAKDKAGTEMCEAAAAGNVEYLKRLLDYGANPDSADYDFRTALHIASAEGYFLVAKLLVDRGANVLFADRWGHTAIDEARSGNHTKLAAYLEAARVRSFGEADAAALPENAQLLASERRIEERIQRMASFGRVSHPAQKSKPDEKLIQRGSPLEAMLTAHTSQMSRAGGELDSEAPVVAMAAAAQGVGKSLTQRAWHDAGAPYSAPPGGMSGRTSPAPVFDPAVRRVTVRARRPGNTRAASRLMRMPRTLEELLAEAGREFDFEPTFVYHEKGGLVTDAQLILDNDVVYVTDQDISDGSDVQEDAKALLDKLRALLG